MRMAAVSGALLVAALGIWGTARADETQDLAVCLNVTVITHREAPPEERLVACNSLIKAHGTKPEASDFYDRASVYSVMDRPSDALADLDTALKISAPGDAQRADYYLDRAEDTLMAGLRTPDAALADAATAIEIMSAKGPDSSSHFEDDMARAYFWRGAAYAEKEDKANASADFKKALSYNGNPERRGAMIQLMTALGYPPK